MEPYSMDIIESTSSRIAGLTLTSCHEKSWSGKRVRAMSDRLYWVNGLWPGKLAVAARPRGGEWLKAELTNWQRAGISVFVSLLTPDEEREFELEDERHDAAAQGID